MLRQLYISTLFVLTTIISVAQSNFDPSVYSSVTSSIRQDFFFDDFTDNSNNWYVGKTKEHSYKIEGGHYHNESMTEDPYTIYMTVGVDGKMDYEIEAKMRFIKGEKNKTVGLNFGKNEETGNYNQIAFTATGYQQITHYYNKEWSNYTEWTLSPIVNPYTYNKLTVRKVGNTMYFFINETLVHTMDKIELYGPKIGFYVSNGSAIETDYLRASYIEGTVSSTKTDHTAPALLLTEPIVSNGGLLTQADKMIVVKGKVTDASGVYEVIVNGVDAGLQADGTFQATVPLAVGDNTVSIKATDLKYNSTSHSFVVNRTAAQEQTLAQRSSTGGTTTDLNFDPANLMKSGKFYALIIAVQDYQDPEIKDLGQPIKDAEALSTVLTTQYTFDAANVKVLKNPTRSQIIGEFYVLSNKLGKEDNLLVFYAGHGYWNEKFQQGYWLPSDAQRNNPSNWLSNSDLKDNIRGITCAHTLLISDACFSGGIFKTRKAFEDASNSVNELYELPSRKAMTSGTLTEVPDKSIFIEYFIKRLTDNHEKYLASQKLFFSLSEAVINNSSVVPQWGTINETGDEGGDFIFIRR